MIRKSRNSVLKGIIFNSFLCTVLVLSSSCFRLRTSDTRTLKQFNNSDISVEIDSFQTSVFPDKIRTIRSGSKNKTTILFVHGAPGSSDVFYDYLMDSVLLNEAQLISMDRPGYGYSGFGKAFPSIKEQSKIISELCAYYDLKNVVVVGHSYGGPIAAYAAILTEAIRAVLMLAPAIDPSNEKIFWMANLTQWKSTRWLVPNSLVVAGDEKFSHVKELQKLTNNWKQLDIPVIHMHGTKDNIVPFQNLSFSKQHFDKQSFEGIAILGEKHFLPKSQYNLVVMKILKLLEY